MEHDDAWRTLALIGLIVVASVVGISAAALTMRSAKPRAVAVDLVATAHSIAMQTAAEEPEPEPDPETSEPDHAAVDRAVHWHALMRLGASHRIAGMRSTP